RPRLVAHDPAHPHALPGRVRLGEQPRGAGLWRDPADPSRRAAGRDHERAAVGDLRYVSRGDRLTMALLELRDVSKSFGGLLCVDGLTMHVGEGESVSLMGANGAGKTTVFNLITGIFRPDAGEIA